MQKNYDKIKNLEIFSGLSEKDCGEIRMTTAVYNKNDVIIMTGGDIRFMGIVLAGRVKVVRENRDGKITVLTELAHGEMFAEVFVCGGVRKSPVTVQASEKTEALLVYFDINAQKTNGYIRLTENMLKITAQKALALNQKNEILSKRTIRERLWCLFEMQQSTKFTLPYNREVMAQYLCADRSAMSNELCKMRDEGLIKFNKNKFELL